jgi:site-specific DNA-methyltransferase (adenine-specific)
MRRRKRLYKQWNEYEAKRRELGPSGQTGLLFALSLVSEETHAIAMNRQRLPVRSPTKTVAPHFDTSRCQFITGDSLIELPKLPANSVNAIVTSPPYWPTKRAYGGKGIGFEKTLAAYIGDLVAVFSQAKRVLRDDGILWVVIDDSYDNGDLRFIPARLAMALQDDGWICRCEIVWAKTSMRPESMSNRPSKDHEKVLMFAKQRHRYYYDGDPIRIPLVRPSTIPGKKKPGMNRRDDDRSERVWSNPMGRNSGSVWSMPPSNNYHGDHSATMPEELVRRCLLVSCPENGTVLDPFGGAGTTALVALKLGHRAISVEISAAYTKEAKQRITADLGGSGEEAEILAAD